MQTSFLNISQCLTASFGKILLVPFYMLVLNKTIMALASMFYSIIGETELEQLIPNIDSAMNAID